MIAIAARAPTGMSSGLVDKVVRGSGAAAVSRVVIANTTVRDGRHDFVPMVVLGVDPLLDSMLATHVVRGAPRLVREHAAALVDGAADVVSPNQVFASYARIYRTPLTLVAILGAVAVLVGCVVLFLTWRLALIDARPLLSRLRLLGVRSSDLLLGSGLVLVPVLVICYAIGATIGCLVGLSLSSFRNQILNFTGQAFDPSLNLTLPLAGGLAASLVMFGFAWLTGVRQLQRATVIDTIAGRDVTVFERSRVRWPLMGGLGCFGMAGLVVAFTAGALQASATVPLLLGVTILSAILPVLAGTSIRALTNGASGLLVGRQLQ